MLSEDAQWMLNRRSLNIDLSARCPLECPRCQRQFDWRDKGEKVPGRDITMSEIEKLAKFYNKFHFCGQLSDPIHHPKFPQILRILKNYDIDTRVHNASSHKPEKYFIECFEANPGAQWIFGIDGLPEESCLYRINQDGEKLFRMMLEAKKILRHPPVWQMIVFSYNEKNIDKCKKMAEEHDLPFLIVQSSRWRGDDDYFKPKSDEALNAF